MGLNQNHTVEDLGGTRCAIVEKEVTADRLQFLRMLLNGNGYTVVSVASATPDLFNIGVTDLMFNPTNAIYGRILHTPNGHKVSPAYWLQQETDSYTELPYFAKP